MLFRQPCRELLHFCTAKQVKFQQTHQLHLPIPQNTLARRWLLQKLSGGMCVKATSLQQPPCNEDK